MELLRLTLITCAYPQNGLSDWSCASIVTLGARGSDDDVAAARDVRRPATATLHLATFHMYVATLPPGIPK